MSRLRNARFTITNSSSHTAGSRYHLLGLGMDPPQLLGLRLEFGGVLEDWVVAVPLGEVLAAHEGPVLGGAPVIVPEVEVEEIDRVRERRTGYHLVSAQAVVNLLGGRHFFIGARDGLLRFGVDAIDDRGRVALHAGLFHVRLREREARTLGRNLGREQVREPLARVVRDLLAVQSAHVAGGAGGDEHVPRGELLRVGAEFQVAPLRREHDAVFRLVVDFELRVVGAHVALAARRRQAGDLDRRRVPRVACGAVADRPVRVRLADPVALDAPGDDRRRAFQGDQRIRGALAGPGVLLLREIDLFGRKPLFAVDRRPRRRGVAAAEELLVLRLVAPAAVRGRHGLRNHEAVVFDVPLVLRRLVALQAAHALGGVGAQLVLVDDRVVPRGVTLRALPRRADQLRRGLRRLAGRALAVDQKPGEYQPEADHESAKDRAE